MSTSRNEALRLPNEEPTVVKIPATIEEAVAPLRAMFAAERRKALELGAIAPGRAPRRKRGRLPYCANDHCPNGLWGPGAMFDEGEHPTWLDGRRRDAAFCSNACRQAAYRARERWERQEWAPIIEEWRPIVAEHLGRDPRTLKPASDWKAWRGVLTAIFDAVEERRKGKEVS
jgi:hypothetical protein